MELFFTVVISGMAVGYITELAMKILDGVIPTWILKIITTISTAVLMNYILGVPAEYLVPAGFASGFFSLTVMSVIVRANTSRK